jgi:hypothetical protein
MLMELMQYIMETMNRNWETWVFFFQNSKNFFTKTPLNKNRRLPEAVQNYNQQP